jgi:hypothetical protein
LLITGWVAQGLGAPLPVAFGPFLAGIVVLLPVAVGIAIVRYDLFDVDRVLGATAAWVLTLAASAAVFAVVVLVVGGLIGKHTGLAPSAAAFVTALTLLPVQRHLATATGRLVDRDRFVAVAEVERFASAVRAGNGSPRRSRRCCGPRSATPTSGCCWHGRTDRGSTCTARRWIRRPASTSAPTAR